MAEVTALKIGLSTPLPSGAKVFGVLAEGADCTCFELTAPDGAVTRFALTLDALAAMVDIAMKLRERAPPAKEDGKSQSNGRSE